MKYIDRPSGSFADRKVAQPDLESVDVIMLTLDADNFLEKCLYSLYREVPVRRLLVCDGGSRDETQSILKKFPRVELFVRPDLKTTGKSLEFLVSLVETEWCVIVDADIELAPGWYDEMFNNRQGFDVGESSRRLTAFHMYKEETQKLDEGKRSFDMCHLARKTAIMNFRCDDDYMWRFTDIMFRQVVENSGYVYRKVSSTMHVHNETERIRYESDSQKNYQQVIWSEPRFVVVDKKKHKEYRIKHAKAVVKYLDPDNPFIQEVAFDNLVRILDRHWVEENGPAWLDRYDKALYTIGKALPFKIIARLRRLVKR